MEEVSGNDVLVTAAPVFECKGATVVEMELFIKASIDNM
jgi:hypothetical protein